VKISTFLTAYFVLLLAFSLYWWKKFRIHRASMSFNFRITDIWAAILGLMPSVLLASYAIQEFERDKSLNFALFVLLLVPAQIVGLLMGRTHIEMPPHTGAKNAFDSGVSILAGAMFGILLAAFAGAGAGGILFFFNTKVMWYGAFLALVVMIFWLRSRR